MRVLITGRFLAKCKDNLYLLFCIHFHILSFTFQSDLLFTFINRKLNRWQSNLIFALHQKFDIASCAPSTKAKKTSCFTLSALDRIKILILPDSPLAWSNQQFTIENIAGLGQNNNLKVMLKHMLLALDRTNLNSFETLSRNCSTMSTMSTMSTLHCETVPQCQQCQRCTLTKKPH